MRRALNRRSVRLDKLRTLISMKTILLSTIAALLLLDRCFGDAMEASSIRQLMERMDDSLMQGSVFYMNYSVCNKNTDAFYARKRELIKVLEDMLSKEQGETPTGQQTVALTQKWDTYRQIVKQCKKELTLPLEQTIYADYSLGGSGFYFKLSQMFVKTDGKVGSSPADIYVSDGKIMGFFSPAVSQAVLQPATERPQVPVEDWTVTAYLFLQSRLSTYMSKYPALSLREENGSLLIHGEEPGKDKEFAQADLRLDKATLTPRSLVFIFHDTKGKLKQKLVKTWQFRKFSGLLVPAVVVDQEYDANFAGDLNLEKERTFKMNSFDPIPINAKVEMAKLLQSDFSVFDEITGNHYLSGNAGNLLDKLSK